MQKKLYIYIAAAALVFSACKKNETDYLFDKPIDERINESLSSYQEALSQAPGWRLIVYPQGLKPTGLEVGGFSYYMKFTNANRVNMVSDFDTAMARVSSESGFRLKALQRPSLFFDTYSYIHVAADPDAYVSNSPAGQNGVGWGSDFNFSFTESRPSDTIVLQGNSNGSEAILVKVSAGEIDSALNKGALRNTIDALMTYAENTSFLSLPITNGKKAALSFDFGLKLLQLFYKNDNNSLVTIKSAFAFTTKGIWLKRPVTMGGYTFQEIFWDQQNRCLYVVSGGNKIVLSSESNPVLAFPITTVIGSQFSRVVVPTSPLYGQSSLFISNYEIARANIKNGGYNLDLGNMVFQFDASSNRMVLNTYVAQQGVQFLAQTLYSYSVNGDSIKFTWLSESENAALIKSEMAPLLDYLATDSFKLSALATTSGFISLFTSNDNPSFYFTGYLSE